MFWRHLHQPGTSARTSAICVDRPANINRQKQATDHDGNDQAGDGRRPSAQAQLNFNSRTNGEAPVFDHGLFRVPAHQLNTSGCIEHRLGTEGLRCSVRSPVPVLQACRQSPDREHCRKGQIACAQRNQYCRSGRQKQLPVRWHGYLQQRRKRLVTITASVASQIRLRAGGSSSTRYSL